MTPRTANIAGIILAVAALIGAAGFAVAAIVYACKRNKLQRSRAAVRAFLSSAP